MRFCVIKIDAVILPFLKSSFLISTIFANMHTLKQLQSGALSGVVTLKLSEGLTEFPVEIYDVADTLEVLHLTGNKLSALPADFGRLKKLRILFCSDNLFTVLPEVLGDCPALEMVGFKANKITTIPPRSLNSNLRWLILTDNCISELPPEIGACTRMEKLMLAGNHLTSLPQELSACRNLSLLRIAANRLEALPLWLLHMPRLAWLAFSGNKFSSGGRQAEMPCIDWQRLTIHHLLGEGASGVIYKASLAGNDEIKDVAVKVFKGAVTSDGLPDHEMNAYIAAGHHRGVPVLLGQINNHPDGKLGLVMELIPERFYNLGLPPTFDTCTRDVFGNDLSLPLPHLLKIAGTISSVAAQLHTRGIMHGDMYAHNTLVDNGGNTLFGDFGAAALYDTKDVETAAALERIEVSAFGYLLDDLLQLCPEPDTNITIIQLNKLRDECLGPDVLLRPDFKFVCEVLKRLENK